MAAKKKGSKKASAGRRVSKKKVARGKAGARKVSKKKVAKKVTKKVTKKASKKKVAKKVSKKKVAKKVSKKKVAATRVAKKKAASKSSPKVARAIMVKQTKLQIIRTIADDVDLTHREVADVFESLAGLIKRHMQRRGSGEFVIPDTGVKIRRVRKPARKSRMGRNPATGESIKIAAKPASTAIKVGALKTLKETIK